MQIEIKKSGDLIESSFLDNSRFSYVGRHVDPFYSLISCLETNGFTIHDTTGIIKDKIDCLLRYPSPVERVKKLEDQLNQNTREILREIEQIVNLSEEDQKEALLKLLNNYRKKRMKEIEESICSTL